MASKNEYKYQHIVPQVYLRGFKIENSKDRIYTFDKINNKPVTSARDSKDIKIEKTGGYENFYSFENNRFTVTNKNTIFGESKENNKIDRFALEKMLSEVEQEYSTWYNNFKKNDNIEKDDSFNSLIQFIFYQMIRGMKFRKTTEKLLLILGNYDNDIKQNSYIYAKDFLHIILANWNKEDIMAISSKLQLAQYFLIKCDQNIITSDEPCMVVPSETNIMEQFLKCDQNLAFKIPNLIPKIHYSNNFRIYFPIDKNNLLMGVYNSNLISADKTITHISYDENKVKSFNNAMRDNAYQYIFSSEVIEKNV